VDIPEIQLTSIIEDNQKTSDSGIESGLFATATLTPLISEDFEDGEAQHFTSDRESWDLVRDGTETVPIQSPHDKIHYLHLTLLTGKLNSHKM
jgi:hypothetical protein